MSASKTPKPRDTKEGKRKDNKKKTKHSALTFDSCQKLFEEKYDNQYETFTHLRSKDFELEASYADISVDYLTILLLTESRPKISSQKVIQTHNLVLDDCTTP